MARKKRQPPPPAIADDDVKMCNCAECGRELVAVSSWALMTPDQRVGKWKVAGIFDSRPHCKECSERDATPIYQHARGPRITVADDGGPWQQNAVRDMEDWCGMDD